MTIAAHTKIRDLDSMRFDVADRRRPHEEAIAIELNAASIVVVMKAALYRVTLAYEILVKDVGDVNVLVARVETVEAAVRVLFEHREIRAVELIMIVVECAEHACAKVVIGKDKPAEVGDKR